LILNFPRKDDFYSAANDFLNSSWESVIEHLSEFRELQGVYDDSEHETESERYWSSAKQTLVSATAAVQQAVEFYIKGQIVEVSPYLLISGSPQSWPKGSSRGDIEFSAFRTIDAQDLLKVHDTVCKQRFDDYFIQWFERLRVIRNKVMHTVDKSLNVTPESVIDLILFAHDYFMAPKSWFDSRRAYLENTPANSMKSIREDGNYECYILQSLLSEFQTVANILKPSEAKKYLKYDKKAKSILCPSCSNKISRMDFWDDSMFEYCAETYQRNGDTEIYHCSLCGHSGKIISKKCSEYGCEGEFLDSVSGVCFSCFCENSL
jgi:hypothetical protein